MSSKQISFIECIHPKNWLIVLGLVCTRIIVLLPFRIIVTIGQAMGLLLYRISSSRLLIAKKNIELCFPALSATEQSHLVKQHFISLGIGFFEVGMARWKSNRSLKKIIEIRIKTASYLVQKSQLFEKTFSFQNVTLALMLGFFRNSCNAE